MVSYYDLLTGTYSYLLRRFFPVLAVYLFVSLIARWAIFKKCEIPGCHSLIPIYSGYLCYRLMWGSGYFFFFSLIPYLGFVFHYIMLYKMCRAFGRDNRFIIGMLLIPIVFRCILAWGSAEYIGPEGRPEADNPYRYD